MVIAPLGKNTEVHDLLQLIAKVPGFTVKVENNNLVARFGPMKLTPAKKSTGV